MPTAPAVLSKSIIEGEDPPPVSASDPVKDLKGPGGPIRSSDGLKEEGGLDLTSKGPTDLTSPVSVADPVKDLRGPGGPIRSSAPKDLKGPGGPIRSSDGLKEEGGLGLKGMRGGPVR